MAKKVIYIAGAVGGPPQNLEDIKSAMAEIEQSGFTALSPTILPLDMSEKQFGQICTAMIQSADGVLLLKNWPSDKGATFAKRYCEYVGKLCSTRLDLIATVLMER